MPSEDRHDAFAKCRASCRKVLRDFPDKQEFKLTCSRIHIELFYEWLQSTDPDMPPAPICKALGPLVGDVMMNDKLQRLDALADTLGPLVIRLGMIVENADAA
jgi:hypothetical protein